MDRRCKLSQAKFFSAPPALHYQLEEVFTHRTTTTHQNGRKKGVELTNAEIWYCSSFFFFFFFYISYAKIKDFSTSNPQRIYILSVRKSSRLRGGGDVARVVGCPGGSLLLRRCTVGQGGVVCPRASQDGKNVLLFTCVMLMRSDSRVHNALLSHRTAPLCAKAPHAQSHT